MSKDHASETLSGRCACKAVTFSTDGPVLWAGHCHCESCRRASSAPFTSFFGVPSGRVTWGGDITLRQSSEKVERGFCAVCGTQMFYRSTVWPDETHLYAATLDDPGKFVPEAHYHWSERVPWITLTDTLARYAHSADTGAPIA